MRDQCDRYEILVRIEWRPLVERGVTASVLPLSTSV